MKIAVKIAMICLMCFAVNAMAQAPVKQTTDVLPAAPRLSYNLSLGASYNSHFGASTFVQPTARYQVTDRFRGFASFTYISSMPRNYAVTSENGTIVRRTTGNSHYIVSVGGDYLVNDRLILSGNVWKDLSNMPQELGAYNNYNYMGRQGADFSATYKISDKFSVSGAVRYTDGASPYYNPYYNSGFGNSPFGY
ncbi:hypothetical protein [Pontibacter populi]|uniref:Outer membrane protein beta-barrel domain-containing protein n=1 Tax=Pontibacter populi TaxID=890055 RepID=A0ABV1RNQ2_9BACT